MFFWTVVSLTIAGGLVGLLLGMRQREADRRRSLILPSLTTLSLCFAAVSARAMPADLFSQVIQFGFVIGAVGFFVTEIYKARKRKRQL